MKMDRFADITSWAVTSSRSALHDRYPSQAKEVLAVVDFVARSKPERSGKSSSKIGIDFVHVKRLEHECAGIIFHCEIAYTFTRDTLKHRYFDWNVQPSLQ